MPGPSGIRAAIRSAGRGRGSHRRAGFTNGPSGWDQVLCPAHPPFHRKDPIFPGIYSNGPLPGSQQVPAGPATVPIPAGSESLSGPPPALLEAF